MEEQSFEDLAVADVLNKYFIAIKIDREVNPDLDSLYMAGVQLIAGRGGWPLSAFLLPNKKLFFGGTYFPKEQFLDLITKLNILWQEQTTTITKQAEQLELALQQVYQLHSPDKQFIGQNLIDLAIKQLLAKFDNQSGGFGKAPKIS